MVRATLFVEGGGKTRALKAPCREAFAALVANCVTGRRMVKIEACGSRQDAWERFQMAVSDAKTDGWVALLVDSEAPVQDLARPWDHLRTKDGWQQPRGVADDQALLMVTCMEAWIAADAAALQRRYGAGLQASALPAPPSIEARSPDELRRQLRHATRDCKARFEKGDESFALLARLNPQTLAQHLPAFQRFVRILDEHLPAAR